ncbi:hypothetical protein DAI22_02g011233 [Oryza sativa Japonica Group]|nr:hypothetical protein DAI22_02g011233 [Oryza sativa Japonica Group]
MTHIVANIKKRDNNKPIEIFALPFLFLLVCCDDSYMDGILVRNHLKRWSSRDYIQN